MEGFELLAALVTVMSIVLLFISILAYKRERSKRVLIAMVVFTFFLLKGLVISVRIFTDGLEDGSNILFFTLGIDVIILLSLLFGILTPSRDMEVADIDEGDIQGGEIEEET